MIYNSDFFKQDISRRGQVLVVGKEVFDFYKPEEVERFYRAYGKHIEADQQKASHAFWLSGFLCTLIIIVWFFLPMIGRLVACMPMIFFIGMMIYSLFPAGHVSSRREHCYRVRDLHQANETKNTIQDYEKGVFDV